MQISYFIKKVSKKYKNECSQSPCKGKEFFRRNMFSWKIIHEHAFWSNFWSQWNICRTADKFSLISFNRDRNLPLALSPSLTTERHCELENSYRKMIFFLLLLLPLETAYIIKKSNKQNNRRQDKKKRRLLLHTLLIPLTAVYSIGKSYWFQVTIRRI